MRQEKGTSPLTSGTADFDHPLEMLAACHERMEERFDTLHRLAAHVASHGADEQARQAAANVVRYFDTAGEHHHRDEEDDLFPRLVNVDAQATERLINRLLDEHAQMRAAWAGVRVPLQKIVLGEAVPLESALIERFTSLYRSHIALEEKELLPLAVKLLDRPALAAIGGAMARRRGVAP